MNESRYIIIALGICSFTAVGGTLVTACGSDLGPIDQARESRQDAALQDAAIVQDTGALDARTDASQDSATSDGASPKLDVTTVLEARPEAGVTDIEAASLHISADGRFLAFVSSADNLVTDDFNGVADAF